MDRQALSAVTEQTGAGGGRRRIGGVLWTLATVAYLAAMAVCTATEQLLAAALLLVVLLAAALVRVLAARNRAAACFLALNLALVLAVLATGGPEKAIGLTLAIAEAVVGALFLRSLRGPGPDLVTRIALAIQPERSARVLAYTRAVCWAWAGLMMTMAAVSLAFTFAAPPRLWWWWKLVGSWALPIGFFIAEWLFRQWVLRRESHPGFRSTLESFARIDYLRLFEL